MSCSCVFVISAIPTRVLPEAKKMHLRTGPLSFYRSLAEIRNERLGSQGSRSLTISSLIPRPPSNPKPRVPIHRRPPRFTPTVTSKQVYPLHLATQRWPEYRPKSFELRIQLPAVRPNDSPPY